MTLEKYANLLRKWIEQWHQKCETPCLDSIDTGKNAKELCNTLIRHYVCMFDSRASMTFFSVLCSCAFRFTGKKHKRFHCRKSQSLTKRVSVFFVVVVEWCTHISKHNNRMFSFQWQRFCFFSSLSALCCCWCLLLFHFSIVRRDYCKWIQQHKHYSFRSESAFRFHWTQFTLHFKLSMRRMYSRAAVEHSVFFLSCSRFKYLYLLFIFTFVPDGTTNPHSLSIRLCVFTIGFDVKETIETIVLARKMYTFFFLLLFVCAFKIEQNILRFLLVRCSYDLIRL